MNTRNCIVRRAIAADADALAMLISDAGVAMNGERDADPGRERRRDCGSVAIAELMNDDIVTLVADTQVGLQGFAQLRWGIRPPDASWMRDSVELRRHRVLARHRGAGVAARLLEGAIELARARDATGVWLKVGKDALQSVGFYKEHGFRVAGTSIAMDRLQRRESWVMHRVVHRQRHLRQAATMVQSCSR